MPMPLSTQQFQPGCGMDNIPICIGMPRSASRMTWQIVKHLSPPEPEWWQANNQVVVVRERRNAVQRLPAWENREAPWPVRSHDYVVGTDPVIYTYRNPIEAYLSLLSRVNPAIMYQPLRTAVHEILAHKAVQRRLFEDSQKGSVHGRRVLWLRYEEHNDASRLNKIMEFMNINLSITDQERILSDVSIQTNITRSKNIPQDINTELAFHQWEDSTSGIQGNHINEATKGKPGLYHKLYPYETRRIMTSPNHHALGQLREFAQSLEYKFETIAINES